MQRIGEVNVKIPGRHHLSFTSAPEGADLKAGDLPVRTTCSCGESLVLILSAEALSTWLAGGLVQYAFPSLSPDQRERLVTGTCDTCWETLFSGLDGDE